MPQRWLPITPHPRPKVGAGRGFSPRLHAPLGKEQKRLRFKRLSGKCYHTLVTIMRW
jgi:hypothetical protein